jgi:rubrerythrin
MSTVRDTNTEKNLMAAFAGESQARNRYDFFAKQAEKEGLIQIARVFAETAEQERSHAKQLYRKLAGGAVEITASFAAAPIGTTAENLAAAADGELHEHSALYPAAAEVAAAEGFDEIAALYRAIAVAERHHERRFRALLERLERGETHRRAAPTTWVCEKCGFTFEGAEPPPRCPACGHPRGHFEILAEGW